jgi:hypothetical protein
MPVEARYYVPPLTSRGRDPLTLTTIVLRAVEDTHRFRHATDFRIAHGGAIVCA